MLLKLSRILNFHAYKCYTCILLLPWFFFSECPNLMYGQNCAQPCPCNPQNTAYCNSTTGRCACKLGYHGYTCDCQRGVHMCDPIISECFMKGSIHECICKPQFSGKGLSCKGKTLLYFPYVGIYNWKLKATTGFKIKWRELLVPSLHIHNERVLLVQIFSRKDYA